MTQEKEEEILGTSIVLYATELRKDLPKAGMRELYELCRRKFQDKFSIGRDQCYNLFRSNGLCQRYRKRPRTTFSNHNYFIFDDLLNTTPKLKPTHFGQLVTDAASRVIVGWQLHPTLSKDGPIEALKKAVDFYRANHVNPAGLIHHSDRGTQYCCNEYIALLQDLGIRASMTQTGDPLHNALAERINNTVKNGWLFETQEKSFEEVKQLVQKAVDIYNRVRPHQSLEMRTPLEEMKRLLEQAA